MEDSKTFNFRLDSMNEKLDSHGTVLESIRKDMNTIAVQSVQIANIQKIQMEHHSDINEIYGKINLMSNWQAGCPRKQISAIWAMIVSVAGAFGMVFLYHVLSGVK